MTLEFFNVYMEPLVKELVQLRKGVVAYDVLQDHGFKAFKLWAIFLLTMHNLLGYGADADVAHQGYAA